MALLTAGGLAAAGYAMYGMSNAVGSNDLNGRVCVITGAGGGLGRETCIEFAKAGCTIICWDLNNDAMQETLAEIRKVSDSNHFSQVVDVTDPQTVYAAATETNTRVQPAHVSILVNNAGTRPHVCSTQLTMFRLEA